MSKENRIQKKEKNKNIIYNSVLSILFFVIGIFLLISSFGSGGIVGDFIFKGVSFLFGWLSFFVFLYFILLGYFFWTEKKEKINIVVLLASIIILFCISTFSASIHLPYSGFIGINLYDFLSKNFGKVLPAIISLAIALITFIFVYEDKPKLMNLENNEELETKIKEQSTLAVEKSKEASKNILLKIFNIISKILIKIFNLFKILISKIIKYFSNYKAKKLEKRKLIEEEEEYDYEEDLDNSVHNELMDIFNKKDSDSDEDYENINQNISLSLLKQKNNNLNLESLEIIKAKAKSEESRQKSIKEESLPIVIEDEFISPNINILNADSGKSSAGDSKFKMNVIQKVLNQFNIPVEMGEVTVGPSVTQFTLKPAQGVNVKKILGLKDNLQMALSATNMHIEAPIPGKPFIGIEIPNEKKTTLGLRSLLELEEFKEGPNLSLAIGKNIIGKPVISDLSKMPHLLVAGATGTGKSVTLHNLILSILYKNSPHDLKLIILDPKRVEFTAYNGLPHLYTPIIKDPKTAIKSLNWAAQEMDRRYDVLSEYGVPNINEYNKKIFGPALEKAKRRNNNGDVISGLPPKMPFIVVVFDEYNDFMLSYPKEITPVITSLTQKARAAGIHLILATQRPDVKVITGTIKANIPSRIALKTTSQIDSRTILDQAGAEDLLGNGDMLYMNGSNIIRVQAPFVSSEEIKEVIQDIKKRYDDFIPDYINVDKIKISSSASNGYKELGDNEGRNLTEEPDDEDYMSARDYVISTGKASTSSLQTAFRWGYNKAARIMNDLETYGIIGPATSGRHREVLYNKNTESDVERLERELEENLKSNTEENNTEDND